MAELTALHARFARKLLRLRKIAARRATVHTNGHRSAAMPVFVLGSGRSGTRLPLVALERAPDVITYSDGHSRLFHGVLLREDAVLKTLLRTTPFSTVVLKPICESHRALEFLERFGNARVVWIFRNYRDAVGSAAAKWTSGPRTIEYLASGDPQRAGWRAGGLSADKLALVRSLYTPAIDSHSAHALMWYLRNSLFFDLKLDERSDVLLVRYEDLAREPLRHFPELFAFLGTAFETTFATGIYGTSVGRHASVTIPEAIEELCRETHSRLLAFYHSRHAHTLERAIPLQSHT